MAAQSLLAAPSARPLGAPPCYAMSERRFKTEDASPPRTHRHAESAVASTNWRRLEDRGPSGHSAAAETGRLGRAPPHGLRYGSSFPYSAVSGYHPPPPPDRRVWPPTSRDDADADAERSYPLQGQRRGDGADQRERLPFVPFEQLRRTDPGRPAAHPWGDSPPRDGTLERGRMPSLDAILQRSSFPVAHRDHHDHHDHHDHYDHHAALWRRENDRQEGRFARDEWTSRLAGGDVDAIGASAAPYKMGSTRYEHAASLPGLRRLPSLTERRSLSPASEFAYSRDRSLAQNPARSSVSALARVASDISIRSDHSTRESGPAGVSRLRSISSDSPAGSTRSVDSPSRAMSQARPMPARAVNTRPLSADSGAHGSVASSEERETRRPVGNDEAGSAPQRKKKKRKVRICTTPGCDKLVVDHGVCIRHGGGKRCNVEGCDCRAQNKGLCWKHGGYTICQVDGCDKRAKSRGMCWSHGGGTQCKTEGCEKIAVSRGRCWAHGGGKRCKLPDCQKPAALRMDDYCTEHYAAFRATSLNTSTGRRGGVDARALYESWQ